MTVTLTEKAAFRLRNFLKTNASVTPDTGIRVRVKTGGCSGYEYAIDISHEKLPGDEILEQDKVRIYLDSKSAELLNGVVIDFVESLTQSGFEFINPNATSTCGCGKSFSLGDCTPAAVPCS